MAVRQEQKHRQRIGQEVYSDSNRLLATELDRLAMLMSEIYDRRVRLCGLIAECWLRRSDSDGAVVVKDKQFLYCLSICYTRPNKSAIVLSPLL